MSLIRQLSSYLSSAKGRDYLMHRALALIGIRRFRYRLVAQPVPPRPLLARPPSGLEIRAVGPEEYQSGWFPRPISTIDFRYRQGAICWVAFSKEQPVGCLWVVPGPYQEDEVHCRFIPHPMGRVAWDFDVYVAENMRLTRTFALLWDTANAWLREHGFQWTVSRIDTLNERSWRAHAAMGARQVGDVIFWRLGQYQIFHGVGGLRYCVLGRSLPEIIVDVDAETR